MCSSMPFMRNYEKWAWPHYKFPLCVIINAKNDVFSGKRFSAVLQPISFRFSPFGSLFIPIIAIFLDFDIRLLFRNCSGKSIVKFQICERCSTYFWGQPSQLDTLVNDLGVIQVHLPLIITVPTMFINHYIGSAVPDEKALH